MRKSLADFKRKINTKKAASLAILLLVLVLLVIGGVMLVRDYDMEGLTATISQRAEELERALMPRDNDTETAVLEQPEEEDEVFERPVTAISYREQARSGEGLTHLARRALNSYLNETGREFSPEERIYAEDYIQLRIPIGQTGGSRWLEVGQEVEISQDLIEQALAAAGRLSQQELSNLTQYAVLAFPG